MSKEFTINITRNWLLGRMKQWLKRNRIQPQNLLKIKFG